MDSRRPRLSCIRWELSTSCRLADMLYIPFASLFDVFSLTLTVSAPLARPWRRISMRTLRVDSSSQALFHPSLGAGPVLELGVVGDRGHLTRIVFVTCVYAWRRRRECGAGHACCRVTLFLLPLPSHPTIQLHSVHSQRITLRPPLLCPPV